jgi:hypothetical protein
MGRISAAGLLALLSASACYSYVNEPPAAPQWDPAFVSGPPGGAMDPGTGYQPPGADPAQFAAAEAAPPADPAGAVPAYEGGTAPGADEPAMAGAAPAPPADPDDPADPSVGPSDPSGEAAGVVGGAAPGAATGSVTDVEIDATLAPYGQWIETEDYGQVWRPDATVVGVDFTPYESCGSWVYTDHGWTFNCEWDWGWLPFHYGQWAWLDDGWGWVRDYTWSPAWVEWRSGGGYVGWRPLEPRIRDHRRGAGGAIVRDHRRGAGGGAIVRDHRRSRDSDWRFASERDFGRTRIRAGLYRNVAEGLRVTSSVPRVSTRGTRVGTAEVMRHRFQARYRAGQPSQVYQPRPVYTGPSRGYERPSRPIYTCPSRGGFIPPERGGSAVPTRDQGNGGFVPPERGGSPVPTRDPRNGGIVPPSRGGSPVQVRDHRNGGFGSPSRGGGPAQVRDHRSGGFGSPSRGGGSPVQVRDHRSGGSSSPSRGAERPSRSDSGSRSHSSSSRSDSGSRSHSSSSSSSSSSSRSDSGSRSHSSGGGGSRSSGGGRHR